MGIWIEGQPYTSFSNVRVKKGRVRLENKDIAGYSVLLEAGSVSANRTISVGDSSGTLVVSGSNLTPIGNTNLLTLDTINVTSARTVGFRDVAGTLLVGLSGSMLVALEYIGAGDFYGTAITITGMTSNDILTWNFADTVAQAGSCQIIPAGAQSFTNGATIIVANVGLAGTPAEGTQTIINYTVNRL